MYCSYCGVELSEKFPSVVCNDCFYEKKKEYTENNPELLGISGQVGITGFTGVTAPVGSKENLDPIPISYFIYSERAGTEKKRLTSKWRMLRFNKPKRMIR